MRNLIDPASMKLKAALLLIAGLLSCALLLLEQPTLKVGLLLAVAIWCFCRAYYFAFYVIEHYIDPGYKFSGLISFARYLAANKRNR
jgi:hypothetical protein